MERTGGEGVDIVLNSLAGEAIARGIGTLREGGQFVEIGKRGHLWGQPSRIGLLAFRRNLSFFAVDIDRLEAHASGPSCGRCCNDVIERFENGTFTPLPLHRVFDLARGRCDAPHGAGEAHWQSRRDDGRSGDRDQRRAVEKDSRVVVIATRRI